MVTGLMYYQESEKDSFSRPRDSLAHRKKIEFSCDAIETVADVIF
jgi:hypothetical protein